MQVSALKRHINHRRIPFKKHAGFTLIELLITISIAAILLTIAAPSFGNLIQDNRINTQRDNLYTAIMFTRSEAVKRGRQVIICSSSNQSQCNGNWQDGWIVFVDSDKSDTYDAGEPLLKVFSQLEGGNSVSFSNPNNLIGYSAEGLSISPIVNTFTLCDSRGLNNARGISIAVTGRISKGTGLACP